MGGPTSKSADMYNYRVMAFLEANPQSIGHLNIEGTLTASVIVRTISPEFSYLNAEISFDGSLVGAELELLCECKFQSEPQALNKNSTEVKDSILEFVAAEKYRLSNIRREGIFYLLISNSPLARLTREIEELKTSDDETIDHYIGDLRERALSKWASLTNPPEIKTSWLRNALMRMRPITIGQDTLDHADKDPKYREAFNRIIEQVRKKDLTRLPLEYREQKTIRLELDSEGSIYLATIDGFLLEIDNRLLNEFASNALDLDVNFRVVPLDDLSTDGKVRLVYHPSIAPQKAMSMVIQAINDHLATLHCENLVVVTPGNYYSYVFNADWMYGIISDPQSTDDLGHHRLEQIRRSIGLSLSEFVLARIVSTTLRMKTGFDVQEDVMDSSNLEENVIEGNSLNT